MSRRLCDYRAYGLWVRSPIALPFIRVPVPPAGEPDVTVRIGVTPEALPAPVESHGPWETAPGAYLRSVRDGVRFLVTGGRDILVELRGSSDDVVGLFLTGSVFAALLQQRGVALLHAGAIETDSGAVLFAGDPGTGKSSLLAALVERGYAMLADDVTGVVPDAGGGAVALSAFPRMKLWADTLNELAWQERARGKVREGWEKYLVPVERFRTTPAGPLPHLRGAGKACAGRGREEARVCVPARRAGGSGRGVVAGDEPAGSPGREGCGTRHRAPCVTPAPVAGLRRQPKAAWRRRWRRWRG